MNLTKETGSAPKQELVGKTIVGNMLEKIAPRIGAKVVFESWGHAGMIIFKPSEKYPEGKKAFFRGSSIGLNPIAPSDIAKDKDFANYFMNYLGYRTIPGDKFFRSDWAVTIKSDQNIDAALEYAQKVGFPLIVKPNSGSQGRGVARVENEMEFLRAINVAFEMDRIALVQKLVPGKDYRLVVLDDRIISAYERIPLNVDGDGVSTIMELMQQKQVMFVKTGRDTKIKFDDPRIVETLALQNLTSDSVPAKDQNVPLLSNANLSSGGDAVDVTDLVNDELKNLCVKLTADMGLRLCGVDVILKNGILDGDAVKTAYIIEINAAPGLDHYANIGEKQEQVVEDLYLEILKSMDSGL